MHNNTPYYLLTVINIFLTFYTLIYATRVFKKWLLMDEKEIKNFERFQLYKNLAALNQIVLVLILILLGLKAFISFDINIGDYTVLLITISTYFKLLLRKYDQIVFKPRNFD